MRVSAHIQFQDGKYHLSENHVDPLDNRELDIADASTVAAETDVPLDVLSVNDLKLWAFYNPDGSISHWNYHA